jgi:hypothetical protein
MDFKLYQYDNDAFTYIEYENEKEMLVYSISIGIKENKTVLYLLNEQDDCWIVFGFFMDGLFYYYPLPSDILEIGFRIFDKMIELYDVHTSENSHFYKLYSKYFNKHIVKIMI